MTTDYLFKQEIEHVLAALMPSNRVVVRVCLHTGLRLGDVLSLRTADIKRQFWVVETKTKKRRRVNLTDDLIGQIMAQAGTLWAFPGRKPGAHRTRQAVWADVKRAAKAFRLWQNVAPHSFRKVYAVELLRACGDPLRVQRALNHSRPATTAIYMMAAELLAAKQKKRALTSGRPRGTME